jgi:hypothetical protein
MKKIRCKQKGVKIKDASFGLIEFNDEPLELEDKIVNELLKNPNLFELVDDEKERRKKSSFNLKEKEE